jgi:hypothetical protein
MSESELSARFKLVRDGPGAADGAVDGPVESATVCEIPSRGISVKPFPFAKKTG